ncbi:MAG: sulfotransferase family protein, partial [Alphaproteobacteria bacterium]|nr:sulfotransferase family protein [Alphaproteobacteria bacterium]
MKEYLLKKGPMALFNRTPLPWARTTPQHIEGATHRILIPEGFCDAAFMVVRDPVERLISEFRYRTEAAVGDGRYRVD